MTTAIPFTVSRRETSEQVRVPWATVVPIAAVVAYADGFWTIAMRGAVGSIERTDAPFRTWLWESTLLLPVYVFAVLAALTLALRWSGPHRRRAHATAATLVAVVAAATLAGVAVLAASSVYDYLLQIRHLPALHSGSAGCDADCLAVREQATLVLQVRAVGLGSLLLLATNLVLVVLVVAFRGGRLDVAARRRHTAAADDGRPPSQEVRLRAFLAACLLGVAAIHAAVVPEYLAEWPAAGALFVLLCVVELALAGLALARFRPAVLRAVAAVSAGTVLLWLDSRTDGLSFGPRAGVPEPVGLADGAATLLAVAALVVAVAALRLRDRHRQPSGPQHPARLAVVAVAAVASVGLGGGIGVLGGLGPSTVPEEDLPQVGGPQHEARHVDTDRPPLRREGGGAERVVQER